MRRWLEPIGGAEYEPGRLPRRTKWSPDGTCLLCAGEGGLILLFESSGTGKLRSVFSVREGESVRCVSWYPKMDSVDPVSCVFASCSKDSPVHLWDAYTGSLRANYRCFNEMDEITAPYTVFFGRDGRKLYSAFDSKLRIFDIDRPGRDCAEVLLRSKTKKTGQKGIVSCSSWARSEVEMLVLGTFAGSVGVYDGRTLGRERAESLIQCNRTGVTDVEVCKDGVTLCVAGRRDNLIQVWDLRNMSSAVLRFTRNSPSNQRIGIDVDPEGRLLYSGDQKGCLRIYDVASGESWDPIECTSSSLNDVRLNPRTQVLASTHGERAFDYTVTTRGDQTPDSSSSSEVGPSSESDSTQQHEENNSPLQQIGLWTLQEDSSPRSPAQGSTTE